MFKLNRKDLIYLPLGIVLLIQLFDKNDSLVIVQYVLLGVMVIALIAKFASK